MTQRATSRADAQRMSNLILPLTNKAEADRKASSFCKAFIHEHKRKKYIFGRNIYTKSILKFVKVDGIIDEYCNDRSYGGIPIVDISALDRDALILIACGGSPLTALKKIDTLGFECLDYFLFREHAELNLCPILLNDGFRQEFDNNRNKFEWIYNLLSDEESKTSYRKLVSFRYNNYLEHLNGFFSREKQQYFESFLKLNEYNATFVDIGSYDGANSLDFIRMCPKFRQIHIFEPDPINFEICKTNLTSSNVNNNIFFYRHGLSDKNERVRFSVKGSTSVVSQHGSTQVDVVKLDHALRRDAVPTLIKMDIEGAEILAIRGATNTIKAHHPRLALSIYHKPRDIWEIAEEVFRIRDDYKLLLRHYTESIYETILFFLPVNDSNF